MRLLIESAIIFFGTLMAAALLALGGPAVVELLFAQATTQTQWHGAIQLQMPALAIHDINPAPSGA